MTSLKEFRGVQAEWLQPSTFQHYYELRSGEALLATLNFPSSWSRSAMAETINAHWNFQFTGLLNPHIVVRQKGSEEAIAIYQPSTWGYGDLELVSEQHLKWEPTNVWGTEWSFLDLSGIELLRFEEGVAGETWKDMFKNQQTLIMPYIDAYRPYLPLLACLGMYLIDLHMVEVGSAVAVTPAAAAT